VSSSGRFTVRARGWCAPRISRPGLVTHARRPPASSLAAVQPGPHGRSDCLQRHCSRCGWRHRVSSSHEPVSTPGQGRHCRVADERGAAASRQPTSLTARSCAGCPWVATQGLAGRRCMFQQLAPAPPAQAHRSYCGLPAATAGGSEQPGRALPSAVACWPSRCCTSIAVGPHSQPLADLASPSTVSSSRCSCCASCCCCSADAAASFRCRSRVRRCSCRRRAGAALSLIAMRSGGCTASSAGGVPTRRDPAAPIAVRGPCRPYLNRSAPVDGRYAAAHAHHARQGPERALAPI